MQGMLHGLKAGLEGQPNSSPASFIAGQIICFICYICPAMKPVYIHTHIHIYTCGGGGPQGDVVVSGGYGAHGTASAKGTTTGPATWTIPTEIWDVQTRHMGMQQHKLATPLTYDTNMQHYWSTHERDQLLGANKVIVIVEC
jgi:hypothetical protein